MRIAIILLIFAIVISVLWIPIILIMGEPIEDQIRFIKDSRNRRS
jgi:hypothetical protein